MLNSLKIGVGPMGKKGKEAMIWGVPLTSIFSTSSMSTNTYMCRLMFVFRDDGNQRQEFVQRPE